MNETLFGMKTYLNENLHMCLVVCNYMKSILIDNVYQSSGECAAVYLDIGLSMNLIVKSGVNLRVDLEVALEVDLEVDVDVDLGVDLDADLNLQNEILWLLMRMDATRLHGYFPKHFPCLDQTLMDIFVGLRSTVNKNN